MLFSKLFAVASAASMVSQSGALEFNFSQYADFTVNLGLPFMGECKAAELVTFGFHESLDFNLDLFKRELETTPALPSSENKAVQKRATLIPKADFSVSDVEKIVDDLFKVTVNFQTIAALDLFGLLGANAGTAVIGGLGVGQDEAQLIAGAAAEGGIDNLFQWSASILVNASIHGDLFCLPEGFSIELHIDADAALDIPLLDKLKETILPDDFLYNLEQDISDATKSLAKRDQIAEAIIAEQKRASLDFDFDAGFNFSLLGTDNNILPNFCWKDCDASSSSEASSATSEASSATSSATSSAASDASSAASSDASDASTTGDTTVTVTVGDGESSGTVPTGATTVTVTAGDESATGTVTVTVGGESSGTPGTGATTVTVTAGDATSTDDSGSGDYTDTTVVTVSSGEPLPSVSVPDGVSVSYVTGTDDGSGDYTGTTIVTVAPGEPTPSVSVPSGVSVSYVTADPSAVSTATDIIGTTVVTITSCSEDKCTETPVTTGVTTICDETTSYTTYCPLTTEEVVSTTVVTITSCADDKCEEKPVTTGVTTVCDETTSYTTFCPLSEETVVEKTTVTVTDCDSGKCHEKQVETGVTTVTVDSTSTYVTYCPLTSEAATTPAPVPTTEKPVPTTLAPYHNTTSSAGNGSVPTTEAGVSTYEALAGGFSVSLGALFAGIFIVFNI